MEDNEQLFRKLRALARHGFYLGRERPPSPTASPKKDQGWYVLNRRELVYSGHLDTVVSHAYRDMRAEEEKNDEAQRRMGKPELYRHIDDGVSPAFGDLDPTADAGGQAWSGDDMETGDDDPKV